MAKRKKHKKKNRDHKKPVVKNTTVAKNNHSAGAQVQPKKQSIEQKIEKSTTKSAVVDDVRYGLLLLGIIVLLFAILYVALMNESIADKVYGIIKLNNLNF